MRKANWVVAVVLLAAIVSIGLPPFSTAIAQKTDGAAKAPKILLKAELDPSQPPFAGAVESVQADGKIRIGPFQAKPGAKVPPNGPLTEGLYLGVVRGTYKDLRDANLIRVKVTNVAADGMVDAEIGRGLDGKLPIGKAILLVRPPQSTSAQLRALPDLITIEPGASPAAEAPASDPPITAAERSAQNLAAIAKAIYRYKDGYGRFTSAAWFGPDGKPWHSWRVVILPYFDEPAPTELYRRYKFDEPWDGPNNKQLLELMPAVYTDQPAGAQAGTFTRYAAVTGPGTMFLAEGSKFVPSSKSPRPGGIKEAEIKDSVMSTLMIGTLPDDAQIPWTKPEDVVIGELPAKIGAPGNFGAPYTTDKRKFALFARADGGLAGLYDTIDPKDYLAMLTIAGKEQIDIAKLQALFLPQAPAKSTTPAPAERSSAVPIIKITIFEEGGKPHARLSR